ncbi:hypothetical protein [Streptomyces sp. NPDC051921]|uniref:hypothetical protein n=1 Tax=Streptomyces sp. NPDC051921 TaxID=3155806 RepID=UPI0034398139
MKDLVIPLLIAVIGLAATVLGAILGARAARFGAEKNAEAVRRQVQDQSAVEHGHGNSPPDRLLRHASLTQANS